VSSTPTAYPTKFPTPQPTNQPTNQPTESPTEQPTNQPTESPTEQPTKNPTAQPTETPTKNPTKSPTEMPTAEPTAEPTKEPTTQPTATPTTPSWLVGGTHAFTFHANTWCGPTDGMIATAAECQAAATSSSVAYQSQAGTTWHAGCIVHNNGAYFVPLTQGASHADATNGGYLCRAPKAAYHSTVWCAAVNGQITSEDQCKGAATKAGMNYVSQAGSEWHAGCIVHDGNVYFVADSGNSANHQQAVNNGYLCVVN